MPGRQCNAVIVGPGLGRLVRYCLEGAALAGKAVKILCIEANAAAVNVLNIEYGRDPAVTVENLALHLTHTAGELPAACAPFVGACHLSVSELLGCWGDNEFLPELISTVQRLFLLDDAVVIPESWDNYLVPVHAPGIHAGVAEHEATYICAPSSPDVTLLAPATLAYSARCATADRTFLGSVAF